MEDWVRLALSEGPGDERACRDWLRATYKLGNTTASGIASFAHGDGRSRVDPDHYLRSAPAMVDAQYAGKKAHLRPIHDRAVQTVLELFPDVRIAPTKTTVPFYRAHVFAHVKASTQQRVDLGLSIRARQPPPNARIVDTGGAAKKDRITWRIPLGGPEEVDDLVRVCLQMAWEEAAG